MYAGFAAVLVTAAAAYPAVGSSGSGQPTAMAIGMQIFVMFLLPVMYVGFAPPRLVRKVWRAREEQALRLATTELLSESTNARALCERALSWAMRLVGAQDGAILGATGAVLVSTPRFRELGIDPIEIAHHRAPMVRRIEDTRILIVPFGPERTGTLAIVSGPFTPLFGEDELLVLEQYGAAVAASIDRVRLLEDLQQERERSAILLGAIDQLGIGFTLANRSRIVGLNDAMTAMHGYTLDEVRALPSVLALVAQDQRPQVKRILDDLLSGRVSDVHFETSLLRKDGRSADVEIATKVVSLEGQMHLVSIVRDVTEKKRAYEREHKRAQQLGALANVAHRLTAQLDPDELATAIADAAREVLGARSAALATIDDGVVRNFASAGLSEHDVRRIGAIPDPGGYVSQLLTMGRPVRISEMGNIRPSGPMPNVQSLLAVPLMRDEQLRMVLYVGDKIDAPAFDDIDEAVGISLVAYAAQTMDVADLFQRERRLVSRLQELDEMKNAFLSAVSHELRTPLTSVIGFAATLEQEDGRLSALERHEVTTRLSANARKLERLLRDLLDLDRLRRGIVQPIRRTTDLAGLIRHVLAEFDARGERPIRLELETVSLSIDAPKVERIVENLLANAVRHTTGDTQIWVRLVTEDGGAVLSVEDAGSGVPPELRETIFEPFRQGPQTVHHAPGVGIGLALVARFTELHGGRCWVEDRPGGGAAFRVFLPGPRLDRSPVKIG